MKKGGSGGEAKPPQQHLHDPFKGGHFRKKEEGGAGLSESTELGNTAQMLTKRCLKPTSARLLDWCLTLQNTPFRSV